MAWANVYVLPVPNGPRKSEDTKSKLKERSTICNSSMAEVNCIILFKLKALKHNKPSSHSTSSNQLPLFVLIKFKRLFYTMILPLKLNYTKIFYI
jgi:hypothetical protein